MGFDIINKCWLNYIIIYNYQKLIDNTRFPPKESESRVGCWMSIQEKWKLCLVSSSQLPWLRSTYFTHVEFARNSLASGFRCTEAGTYSYIGLVTASGESEGYSREVLEVCCGVPCQQKYPTRANTRIVNKAKIKYIITKINYNSLILEYENYLMIIFLVL